LGLVIQDEDYFPGETDPYELSLDAFIDLEGHEFVGREQALATASAPPRRFKTLEIEGDALPRIGEPVTRGGVTVGDLRSVEVSPRFGPLALAVLESSAAIDGTTVEADHIGATVRSLPFDREARARSNPRDPARVG
jgi:glycine cleavage system aminomethyltransferase T